jgi:energy-coupling factor transporter ATP-binding protein EcfA2
MHGRNEANPFRIDGPVWRKEHFVGRSREIQRILRLIQEGQSISVVGSSGCGKTSLLDHIARAGVLEQHGMRAAEHIFLWLSGRAFAGVDQATCLCGFCQEICIQFEQLGATLKARLVEVRAGTELAGHRGLRTLFRIAQECGFRPVLVLDDFDDLAKNDLLEDSFFAALRSLATGGGVVYLVASRRPLYELEKARPEASTLCGICQQFLLRPFAEEESRGLVLDYLSRTGIEFPSFAIDCILGLGRDEPHSLQLAGYHAFEVWRDNGGKLQERDCIEVEQRFGQAVERAHG